MHNGSVSRVQFTPLSQPPASQAMALAMSNRSLFPLMWGGAARSWGCAFTGDPGLWACKDAIVAQ